MAIIRNLFFCILLFLSFQKSALANNVLYIDEPKDKYSVYDYVYIYVDNNRKFTYKDVLNPANDELFKKLNSQSINLGFSNDNCWIRFTIENRTSGHLELAFSEQNSDISHLTFYNVVNNIIKDSISTGEEEDFNSRKFDFRFYVFRLDLDPGESHTYYLKANNAGDVLALPLSLDSPIHLAEINSNQNLMLGIIFGLFIFIVLYNLFLYLSVRDRLYMYYSLYVLFLCLFAFNLEGFSFKYFWPGYHVLNDQSTMIFFNTTIFFLFIFSRIFLNIKNYSLLLYKVCRIFEVITFLQILISFSSYPYLLISAIGGQALCLLAILFIMLMSIVALIKSYKPAYYFIGAFTIVSSGVAFFVFRNIGLIPENLFTRNALYIGLVSQSLLLSLAALDRFRRIMKESNAKLKEQKEKLELTNMELLEARDKALESDKLKTAFLSNMSHEIRTPMNSVVGFVGILTDPELTNEQKKKFVNLINTNCRSLLNLIDDIIDLAQIETGEIKIMEDECKLNKILDKLYNNFLEERIRFEKAHLEIFLSKGVNKEDYTVLTDQIRLQQILSNLMMNSLKFTDEGFIEFGYKFEETLHANSIIFYVKDTGKGLSEDKIQIIFEKFRKLDDDKSKVYSGTGMGLAISKSLVSLLGGNIWVESEVGKGTTFFFSIPLKVVNLSNEAGRPISGSGDVIYDLHEKSILVLENYDNFFLSLKDIFRNTGVRMYQAKDANKAMEICRSSDMKPDLILINQSIFDDNGESITGRIRQLNENIPIITITDKTDDLRMENISNDDSIDHIYKSLDKSKILSKINFYLSGN